MALELFKIGPSRFHEQEVLQEVHRVETDAAVIDSLEDLKCLRDVLCSDTN